MECDVFRIVFRFYSAMFLAHLRKSIFKTCIGKRRAEFPGYQYAPKPCFARIHETSNELDLFSIERISPDFL